MNDGRAAAFSPGFARRSLPSLFLGALAVLFIVILPFFSVTAAAAPADAPRDPVGSIYVQDDAHVLSDSTKRLIRDVNKKLEASDYKAQLMVVTADSVPSGGSIESWTISLAEKYRPGEGKKDTGLVYALAVKDHKDRLEVGYGLEDVIPDATAEQIISQGEQQYGKGNYDAGVREVVTSVGRKIAGNGGGVGHTDDESQPSFLNQVLILAIILIGGLVWFKITRSVRRGRHGGADLLLLGIPQLLSRRDDFLDDDDSFTGESVLGGGDSFRGGDSFGGDSFGGGDFGGGGASGSW
ncbi:TPM domain-containing protein [Bifidobacterium bombi]|uniref:TPM domain-containing protein n=1 Tax=Bifidobacterium bombi DSM 19703 TaxID=1341695 RepID=A0A080N2P5_9BIFI|nr:TPM domain-containing protein [Bifidobacterium bombi]KFF31267.1 hypothetical protein BBOMB_0607 [Bifidobacterium bombi DSM 19703]